MNLTVQAIKIPRAYVTSAFVFSISRAVAVGYVYRGFSLHLHDAVTLGGGWFSWAALFAILFLFLSFVPKPKWAYGLNPISLTLLVWMLYYLGVSSSDLVRENLKTVALPAITNYFGGPIWIMLITWLWHFVVCLQFFEDESEND